MCLAAGYKVSSQYGHYYANKKIKRFIEKPLLNNPINIGYFFFKKSIINSFSRSHKKDLENGIIKSLYEKNNLEIFLHKGFWKSVDSYKEYEDLKKIYEK